MQHLTTTQTDLDEIQTIAKLFAASGYFKDVTDVAKCATKLLIGRTLGLDPLESMTGLNLIQGSVNLSAHLMASSIKKCPKYDYQVKERTEQSAVIDFYDVSPTGEKTYMGTESFSMDQARQAGIAGGQPWRKYPKAMLFARCISQGYRTYTPDALGSRGPVYVEEHGETEIPKPGSVPVAEYEKARQYETDQVRQALEPAEDETRTVEGRSEDGHRTVGGRTEDETRVLARQTMLDFLDDNPYNSHTFVTNVYPTSEADTFIVELNKPVGGEHGIDPGSRKTVKGLADKATADMAVEALQSSRAVTGKLVGVGNTFAGLDHQFESIELLEEAKPDPKPAKSEDPPF